MLRYKPNDKIFIASVLLMEKLVYNVYNSSLKHTINAQDSLIKYRGSSI